MNWQPKRWITGSLSLAITSWCVIGFAPTAQAYNGERIISSQVISDVAVGTTDGTVASANGDCATGDCGGADGGVGGAASRTHYGQPDLFYNYYTQGMSNQANAQMYLSPVPVPAHVGHTFFTYQPFYPHQYLYKHTDRFHNYYDNGRGLNRTRVHYSYPPVKTAVSNFYWNVLRLPR